MKADPEKHAPQVACSHCDGAGFVKLPKPYARSYYLTSTSWESTDTLLGRHVDGVNRTALINRLNLLVRCRLVERRKSGAGRGAVEWRRR